METTGALPLFQRNSRYAGDSLPRVDKSRYPALAKSFRRGARGDAIQQALEDRARREADCAPRPFVADREHAELEARTETFRRMVARKHLDRVREEHARYHSALDLWSSSLEQPAAGYFVTKDGEIIEGDAGEAAEPLTYVRRTILGDCSVEWIPVDIAATPRVPDLLVEEMGAALSSKGWHSARARGQRERFDRLRACGSRVMFARCGTCGRGTGKDGGKPTGELRAVPEGCGVRRVCKRCDVHGAVKRRARFGRARGRIFINGERRQLRRKFRKGGRYAEKMLTLTCPHVKRENVSAELRDATRDDVHVRIEALFRAWPRFARKLKRHLVERWETDVAYHRAFEWTPGREADELGHPHFHVYLFAPFVDVALVREWWAEALEESGVPIERDEESGRARVIVYLQMLREFDTRAVRELLKGGRRQALTLSRVELASGQRFDYAGPGIDAFEYSEGWSLSDLDVEDETRARLYMALEGRRLTQASRGFFEADDPPVCLCCGSSGFLVHFESAPVEGAPTCYSEGSRAPP